MLVPSPLKPSGTPPSMSEPARPLRPPQGCRRENTGGVELPQKMVLRISWYVPSSAQKPAPASATFPVTVEFTIQARPASSEAMAPPRGAELLTKRVFSARAAGLQELVPAV